MLRPRECKPHDHCTLRDGFGKEIGESVKIGEQRVPVHRVSD